MSRNSGTATLTSDSCAGCHRAHTAKGAYLLKVDEETLCQTCHGGPGQGATTNVVDGVQYAPAGGSDPILGALRAGGFINARIAAGTPARIFKTGSALNSLSKVSVGSAASTTSAHLRLTGASFATLPGRVWGNDGLNTGAGPTVTLACASCHNPHGNGNYRILNPVPAPASVASGTFVPGTAVAVIDAAVPPPGDARNYTVMQIKPAAGQTYMLLASDVLDALAQWDGDPGTVNSKSWPSGNYTSAGGDYWHVRTPWNDTSGNADAPNGQPSGLTPFNTQIEAWCSSCHTRYHTEAGGPTDDFGDAIFQYKHQTTGRTTCTTCHVAHGSNAAMVGDGITDDSASFPYPGETGPSSAAWAGSSRLLKVNNRGTCQLCHDPTGTVVSNVYTGPVTVPGVP